MRRQVRAHVGLLRVALDDVPELLARHPVAARGHEQRVGRACAEQRRPRVAQVALDPAVRDFAERHEPFLRALAHHAHDALVEPDLDGLQRDELAHAQPARIHQLEHRAIAQAERRANVGRTEQRLDLRLGQRRRKPRGLLRRRDPQRRVRARVMLAHGPAVIATEHRQAPVRRRRLAVAARGDVADQHRFVGRVERRVVRRGQPLRKQHQIAPVRIERIAREPVLEPQRIAEHVDRRAAREQRGRCGRVASGIGVGRGVGGKQRFTHRYGTPSCASSQRFTFW
jgi:hypothetical protein